MPVYSYRCEDCNEITEAFQPLEGARNSRHTNPRGGVAAAVVCEYCDGPTHRIVIDFPHIKFDYMSWSTREDNTRLILHGAKAGKSSGASEIAHGRT